MRKPKALVIPLKFREGYPDEIVDVLIKDANELMTEKAGLDIDVTPAVTYDADADKVAAEYNPANYDFCVLLVPTWFEPITMVRAAKTFFELPMIVWGFSNFMQDGIRTNLGSSAGAGVTKGTLREYGVKHEYIYYSPKTGHDDVIVKKLQDVGIAARAVSLLKRSRILTVGVQFGGMTLGDMDLVKMQKVFGVDLMEADAYQVIKSLENMPTDSEFYKECEEKVLRLTGGTLGNRLEKMTRFYAALKKMVGDYQAQALTMKCHFVFSQEYGLTPCIPLSIIGDEVVSSCEADLPVTLTQLVMHYLSGGNPTAYADTHDLTGERVLMAACGYAPAGMCIDDKIIAQLPPENATGLGATFAEYITNKNYLKEGGITVGRILKDPDGGYTLHATGGHAVGDVGACAEIGMPQYSFTEVIPDCDFDTFAQDLGSHHYALCYADLKDVLPLFCKYVGIRLNFEKPVK